MSSARIDPSQSPWLLLARRGDRLHLMVAPDPFVRRDHLLLIEAALRGVMHGV